VAVAVTFVTNTQIKTLMVGLTHYGDTELDLCRSAAYSRVLSALSRGGYTTATFTAAKTAFGYLTLLEARLVALDLLGGSAASSEGSGGGKTWLAWEKYCTAELDRLAAGLASINNDLTGTLVTAPADAVCGIATDARDPGINLDDPFTWPDVDKMYRNDGE